MHETFGKEKTNELAILVFTGVGIGHLGYRHTHLTYGCLPIVGVHPRNCPTT